MSNERSASAMAHPVLERILDAVSTLHRGNRKGARRRLEEIWSQLGGAADPFHLCILAHYMADAQDDPEEELRWDGIALSIAEQSVGGGSLTAGNMLGSLLPSLHLNVAAAYLRMDRTGECLEHVERARTAAQALPTDGYREFVGAAIEQLATRAARTSASSGRPA